MYFLREYERKSGPRISNTLPLVFHLVFFFGRVADLRKWFASVELELSPDGIGKRRRTHFTDHELCLLCIILILLASSLPKV